MILKVLEGSKTDYAEKFERRKKDKRNKCGTARVLLPEHAELLTINKSGLLRENSKYQKQQI